MSRRGRGCSQAVCPVLVRHVENKRAVDDVSCRVVSDAQYLGPVICDVLGASWRPQVRWHRVIPSFELKVKLRAQAQEAPNRHGSRCGGRFRHGLQVPVVARVEHVVCSVENLADHCLGSKVDHVYMFLWLLLLTRRLEYSHYVRQWLDSTPWNIELGSSVTIDVQLSAAELSYSHLVACHLPTRLDTHHSIMKHVQNSRRSVSSYSVNPAAKFRLRRHGQRLDAPQSPDPMGLL